MIHISYFIFNAKMLENYIYPQFSQGQIFILLYLKMQVNSISLPVILVKNMVLLLADLPKSLLLDVLYL